mmetsp:Transcript_39866/g.77508  ORF Transcript_39866/g.77508 Transcript_39866/m.77508 type:complete len:247 (-) Transcript_39866:317-1057(-)
MSAWEPDFGVKDMRPSVMQNWEEQLEYLRENKDTVKHLGVPHFYSKTSYPFREWMRIAMGMKSRGFYDEMKRLKLGVIKKFENVIIQWEKDVKDKLLEVEPKTGEIIQILKLFLDENPEFKSYVGGWHAVEHHSVFGTKLCGFTEIADNYAKIVLPFRTMNNVWRWFMQVCSNRMPLTATKEILRAEKDRRQKAAHRKKHRIGCTCGKTVAAKDLKRHKRTKTCIARTNEKKNAEDFFVNCFEGTH